MVEEFDFETGRLLDKLDELNLTESTLVIYTTDNGPWCQPKYYNSKMGLVKDDSNKNKDSRWFMPEGSVFWGDPGPLRGGKGSAYEAGSRVPCIVRWPGKVPAGRESDALFATIDFLPTFLSLAVIDPPDDCIIDGIDQTHLLLGQTEKGRETFVYDQVSNECVGIRQGKWKLLMPGRRLGKGHRYLMDFGTDDIELYDLSRDIGEKNNLAASHPEIVQELRKTLMKFKLSGDNPTDEAGNAVTETGACEGNFYRKIQLKESNRFDQYKY